MKKAEHEKKILLSLPEYNALFQALSDKGFIVTQINHYYDTPNLDGNTNGITYRIREKNGKFTATVKSHRIWGVDGSIEISGNVSSPFDTSFFAVSDLSYQGYMTTERLTFCPCEGIKLALDKNSYLHFIDYELEIEYSKNAEDEVAKVLCGILNILHANNIRASFSNIVCRLNMGPTKSERFCAKQTQLKGR